MAVLGRLLIGSAERIDLPDILSIDSYAAGDWRFFLKGLVGDDKPFILKGFDIIDPQNAIGTQSCSIRVADSAVFYPGSNTGSFYHGLAEGNINAAPLVPELRKNATNFVYLTFSTFNTSVDTRAFWDPDKDGGVGGEFTQDVNTESVLKVDVNVSTGSFPANTIPIAKVVVGPVVITSITDCRDLLFRLGSGGISPDPFANYQFRSLPDSSYQRSEPPITMSAGGNNPFQGGDKNVYSLKEWMDLVMTKFKELSGTTYWYEDLSTYSLISGFVDALSTTFKSKGQWQHSSATPGQVTWTEDIQVKVTQDPRDTIIRAGTKTLNNEEVAYINLQRGKLLNSSDQAVSWTNGQPYINTVGGAVGYFANLSQGDWVKKVNDENYLYLRVEQFYDSVNLGGSTTTAANARSVRLSGNYQGTTIVERGRYDKGVYQSSDVVVSSRSSAPLSTAGGNFHWLVTRSDVIENISSIDTFTVSGTLDQTDGSTARVTATSHGLSDGDRITVAVPAAQAGTYVIEVEDANTFYIETTNTTTGSFTGYYGVLTTAARDNGYGLQLESANHGFNSDDTIIIASTTNYDGSYLINKRSNTQIQFPFSSNQALESVGTATLVRVNVRAEQGLLKIVQGESVDIGDGAANNLKQFVGMNSFAETHPTYIITPPYNTLDGMQNYNALPSDNLTERVSKLTAMMADKAQDKTLKYLTSAATVINTTNGSAQEITFLPSSSSLTILQPGSGVNTAVTLPDASPGISLLVNQSAYVSIDRNNTSAPTIQVTNTSDVPISENIVVIASRLSNNVIYIWDGTQVIGSASLISSGAGLIKVNYFDPLSTSLPTGNPVTEDNVNISAGDLILFSNLSSGNNRIYKAVGTGSNITSWIAQYSFAGSLDPTDGDTVIVLSGDSFADQIGKFTGTSWVFNNKVRYFNGADYWEQSNIVTSTLNNNTTDNVFTVNYVGSEYMIVDYSINRASTRETGTIHITTDGTSVSVATSGSYIGSSGVTFSGDILGPLVRLRYTADASGSSATMKYMVRRWSNAAGGPGGLPNYSGFTGTSVNAAGSAGDIQFSDGAFLSANSNLKFDSSDNSLNQNGLHRTPLSSIVTLNNNTVSNTPIITLSSSSYKFLIIEYSLERDGESRVGRMLLTNNGTATAFSDDFVETAIMGINFSSDISGSTVRLLYNSTNTGFNASFKYSTKYWS